MLSRISRAAFRRQFTAGRQFVRYSSALISHRDTPAFVQKNRTTSNRLCIVSTLDFQVRNRRFDSKNDPKDDDNQEDANESQSVRAVYDVKSNADNTSIATIQVPDDIPFLPLVTIMKPPLYPRLFRIVEVCVYLYNVLTSKSHFQTTCYQYFTDKRPYVNCINQAKKSIESTFYWTVYEKKC